MTNNSETYLQEIQDKIERGVILFLGAGASHAAGGALGTKLTDMIKKEFPKIDQSLTNLIDVCQDVIDTPPYHRNELEAFIRDRLGNLQPTPSHKTMTRFDWPAIFTTNFDDLIELSYRITPERMKPCYPIYSDWMQVNVADRSKVYLFKMMGCMTAAETETGGMVLSRSDVTIQRKFKYLLPSTLENQAVCLRTTALKHDLI